ncbi:MAG TPA: class I SAM-dependent methyltransferase [Pseudomonadales bacterium]|nr:class I SAM-dependent methyltransferase [Pseudomonadales bacterium]
MMVYVRAPKSAAYYCPVCNVGLRRWVIITWEDTVCCLCSSSERNRLAWWFLERRTPLFDGKQRKMLHIAPEEQFVNRLSAAVGPGYITADLLAPRVMVHMDITKIQYGDNFFDVIFCSHVLEHVPNDRLAIKELGRVLKPGGFAVIQVPIVADTTFEDPSIIDPRERLRLFGQEDHVRVYGPDFIIRLKDAGLNVQKISASDFLGPEEIARGHLTKLSGDIFYCTK